jgi:benzoyl-CoA reductase/2-hydroxyglutaryl-CoA dehydratase subunit BcrC/BadD/HgdB
MKISEYFGGVVNKNFLEKPGFTRGFIKLGFGVQHYLLKAKPNPNHLSSQRYLTQISMESILNALRHPKNSAIVNIFTPCEPLHAMGIHPLCAEGFSSYLTGGYSEKGFLEYAEQLGVPETFCSYHKALVGAAESGVLPRPRFLVTTSTVCDANINSFRRIADYYGLREFVLDVPHEDSGEAVSYVAGQIVRMVEFIEDTMRRKMDREKFLEAVQNTNASMAAYRRFLDELEDKYFPTSVSLQMFNLLPTHILMGSNETRRFYEMQLADIMECVPAKGKRILWSHVLPYYAEPASALFDFNPRMQLLVNDLCFDYMNEIPLDDPYKGFAERLINNTMNGDFERKTDAVLKMCRKLHADGVVCFCHWGCKQSSGGVYLLKQALEAEGIPALILDGDACDRRNSQTGQMSTRLEAFAEMLEKKQ